MKRYLSLLLSIGMVAAISLPLFAAGGAEESDAPGETPGVETNACDDGFRLFDHELLATDPVCIPEHPQRVTYLLYPSFLYPFGINPVGSWGLERDAENYPFIADWIADGTIDHGMPPNIEVLVGLEPDLMIYDINRVTDVVDELPTIAPLVTYDVERSSSWQQRHRFNGAVLAQEALAEAQIAEYFTDETPSTPREARGESARFVT